jgi:hypothetical protein
MTRKRESPQARQAFEAYCHQERRSLRKLADEIGVPFSTLRRWSEKYDWQERVRQYDIEVAAAAREAARKEAARLAERRMKHAEAMQQSGLLIIGRARIAEMSDKEARAALATAFRLLAEGMRAERLELGESTENIKALAPPKPLERMSDAELEAYMAQLEQAL